MRKRKGQGWNAEVMVGRSPVSGGGDAYLLRMLEFQSSSDRWMALRAMSMSACRGSI
ncbi:MAG: hypothetical protein P4M00_21915 [Azospirillaceae bacterium]|nr:hypothetical protein [Azospirillaceae bacterium]